MAAANTEAAELSPDAPRTPQKRDVSPKTPSVPTLEQMLAKNDVSPIALVAALKAKAKALKEDRLSLKRELKNAQKRSKRLRERARALKDMDLLDILRMRHDARFEKADADMTSDVPTAGTSSAVDSDPSEHGGGARS